MPAAKKTEKKTTEKKEKKEVKISENHWSNRRTTDVDKNKRTAVEGSKIDSANIIATPRKRKNIDYKAVNMTGDVKPVKRATANTYEKRASKKIEKPKKRRKTTTKKTKKDEAKEEEEKKEEKTD